MQKYLKLCGGVLGTNCYILYNDARDAVIIDPGFGPDEIFNALEQNELKPSAVILTHGHGDHILALNDVRSRYSIPLYMRDEDAELIADPEKNMSRYFGRKVSCAPAEYIIKNDETVRIQSMKFAFIHTPGHTKGSMCILTGPYLFTGDTLFEGSIGRTDFYGGSQEDEVDSVNKKLKGLNPDLIVLPGHGPSTTLSRELETNPVFNEL